MANFTWKSSANGDWSDADNWQNGSVPTATDSVTVPSYAAMVYVTTSISCASIDNSGYIYFNRAGPADISGDVVNNDEIGVNGTDVTIGGTLFNLAGRSDPSQTVFLISEKSAPARLTVGAIDNTSYLTIGPRSTLDVEGPASFGTAGTVTGKIRFIKGGLIAFSGTDQITTIAGGASLVLAAPDAFVADAGIDDASNSALTGLRNIDGLLLLEGGAEIDTTRGMVVGTGGSIVLGKRQTVHGSGTLTMQGTLVNQGTITGTGGAVLEVGGNVVDEGTIGLQLGAEMDVAGAMTVTSGGTVTLTTGADLAVEGAVEGTGRFSLGRDATATFGDAVGRRAQFVLGPRDVLELADPADFHASIQNFGAGDAYLIDGFDAHTKYDFVSNAAGTGGVLDVSDGAMGSAHIHMKGAYDTGDFALTSDAHGVRITSTR